MKLGIDKAGRQGVAVVALRNSGHLGRIGDWAEMAAKAGKVSLHFVNTSGGGILVAPFGGNQRRLSANPIAAGVPVTEAVRRSSSTSRPARSPRARSRSRSTRVRRSPTAASSTARAGRPTTPRRFYASPPGRHSAPWRAQGIRARRDRRGARRRTHRRLVQPARNEGRLQQLAGDRHRPAGLRPQADFNQDLAGFTAWVKSSRTVAPDGEILMPGEPEHRSRIERMRAGIPLDPTTWKQLQSVASSLGIPGHGV